MSTTATVTSELPNVVSHADGAFTCWGAYWSPNCGSLGVASASWVAFSSAYLMWSFFVMASMKFSRALSAAVLGNFTAT